MAALDKIIIPVERPNVAPNVFALSAFDDLIKLSIYKVEDFINISKENVGNLEDFKLGDIKFEHIYYSYDDYNNILNDINIVIKMGEHVVLRGNSGCGKSTTVNLIERLYEPNSGKVLIDGRDIKEYDLEYLRSLIGYVQQEPVLFNRSIKENLIFGRDELVSSLGDPYQIIKEACEESYAKEFIEKNLEKYDYIVGIKGSKLSGGQKQRIAIARAILLNPKIIILDEATSALDYKNEQEVQKALDNLKFKNITTFVISHRLCTFYTNLKYNIIL